MTKLIAMFKEFKDLQVDQIKDLAHQYGYQVKMEDELLDTDDQDIAVIYGWSSDLTQERLETMPALKWIQKESAGVDAIPLSFRQKEDLLISNMSGIHAQPISEHVFAYILSHYRCMPQMAASQAQGVWSPPDPNLFRSLDDKTILVYGTGNIGIRMAQIGAVLGSRLIGVNTNGRPIEGFDQCIAFGQDKEWACRADIIINAMPLTDLNREYFDLDYFKTMKSSALFINIGRGASVKEADLHQALSDKLIESAYLDVFESEPLSETSPLWQLDNIVITPHITGIVEHFMQESFKIFFPNLQSFLAEGVLVRNQVDPQKGY